MLRIDIFTKPGHENINVEEPLKEYTLIICHKQEYFILN